MNDNISFSFLYCSMILLRRFFSFRCSRFDFLKDRQRTLRQLTLVRSYLESSNIDMLNMEVVNMDRVFSDLTDIN